MSFTGNGGGRFQIRRIRNGSTAESIIIADGPFQQDFSDPTGFHDPNWDTTPDSTAGALWDSATTYATGNRVIFGTLDEQGVYESLQDNNTGNSPTLNTSNDYWEFEGFEGDPLILSPQLLVNGVNVALNGTRAAAPVNALIADLEGPPIVPGVQWQVQVNGVYRNVDTNTPGFRLITSTQAETEYNTDNRRTDASYPDTGTNAWLLAIDRNLDLAANFNTGALQEGRLYIRAVITYTITGVTDMMANPQPLTSEAYAIIQRTVLTESSMFSRIQLVDTGSAGSSAQIWNSGFTGPKSMDVDLFIGANNILDNPDSDVEITWFRIDPGNNRNLITDPIDGITFSQETVPPATPETTGNHTNRRITITRAAVLVAGTFFATVREVTTGDTYTSNSIELRDFLDPIQFVETGTATIDTGSNGRLTIVPYQNGQLMDEVNPTMGADTSPATQSNTEYTFELNRLASPTDTTGVAMSFNNLDLDERFPENPRGRAYTAVGTLARGTASCYHDRDINGATIVIEDTEVGPFGMFIDYAVQFTMVS